MIEISKEESEKIRKVYKDVSIYRTMKGHQGKHRGKRNLPEMDKYLELIKDTNEKAAEILKEHKKFNMRFYQN